MVAMHCMRLRLWVPMHNRVELPKFKIGWSSTYSPGEASNTAVGLSFSHRQALPQVSLFIEEPLVLMLTRGPES